MQFIRDRLLCLPHSDETPSRSVMPRLGVVVSAMLALALVLGSTVAPVAAVAQEVPAEQEIPDPRISEAVHDELLGSRGVSVDAVDIHTVDGVVTLSGTVRSVLAKDRTARIARMVKRVRAVVNNLEVAPTVRSDEAIRRDVLSALATDPATESWEIDVDVTAGVVTLSGAVDSWQEARLAERVTKGVKGVRHVVEELAVDHDTERSDREIEADVEQALMWDARVGDALIDVAVANGRVTLSGAAGSAHEKSLAIADAWVTGVESVDASGLEVTWWARDEMTRHDRFVDKSDEAIRQAVLDAFLYDPRVASFEPEVRVEDGIVTLSGVVDNVKAKRAAAQDAANTVGVWRVKNHLKVRPAEGETDASIAEEIRADLLLDPYVDRFDITVDVEHGVARLGGQVDSYFDKYQAGDIAARVPGVVDVDNHLEVDYEPLDYETAFKDFDVIESDGDVDLDRTVRRPDWEIREDIEDELWWSPFVDADEVTVTVDEGTATLTGTVDSVAERNAATEQALEGGAVVVHNDLEIDWSLDFPFA